MGPDVLLRVPEGCLIERGFALRHVGPEVNDPIARWASSEIPAVEPRLENVGIGPPVRIGRKTKPCPSDVAGNVERSALGVAHVGDAGVCRVAPCLGQVDAGTVAAGRKVGMDLVGRLAVHVSFGSVFVARSGEADQGYTHRCAVDHPRLIRPRIEDRSPVGCGLQGPPVRAAAYRVGRDQTDTRRPARCDLLARLHEPVADEIGFRRHAAPPCGEHSGDVILPKPADQQLAAEERRIADHDIDSMVSSGSRIGSAALLKPLRRIHWISPIHTETRASSAA